MKPQTSFVTKNGAHHLGRKTASRLEPVSQAHSHRQTRHDKGGGLLAAAACLLLLLLAAAQGYVSFRAQYTFIDHTKHTQILIIDHPGAVVTRRRATTNHPPSPPWPSRSAGSARNSTR